MAKFKCVHSGCVYEWTDPEMIANMQAHDEYEELVEAVAFPAPVAPSKPKKQIKGE